MVTQADSETISFSKLLPDDGASEKSTFRNPDFGVAHI